jgi:23S rRNA G2445 N2-methylase RlmL
MKNGYLQFCAETFEGLEDFCKDEILKQTNNEATHFSKTDRYIFFEYKENLEILKKLRLTNNIYISIDSNNKSFDKELISNIEKVLKFSSNENFTTFRFAIPKHRYKSVESLVQKISNDFKLKPVAENGDLIIKILERYKKILIRISPKPLSVRSWRVKNYNAALNSTIASMMVHLIKPLANDFVLNICAGSGTLLIERCLTYPSPKGGLGVEMLADVMEYGKENMRKASLPDQYKIIKGDCTQLTQIEIMKNRLENDQKFNVVLGDLPFGLTNGHKKRNRALYKKMLGQIFKVSSDDARICLITEDQENMIKALNDVEKFNIIQTVKVKVSTNREGHFIYPIIYLLNIKNVGA